MLTADDFTIIPDNSTRIKNDNLAITRTGITYSLTARPGAKTFEIKIYATMHKPDSYIKEWVLQAPQGSINYLLNHEQKHFDISEIFAREAVKAIRGKRFTKNYAKEINTIMQNLFKRSEAMHDAYDKETGHGTNAVVQREWNDKIENGLKALEAYKNKTIVMRVY